VEGAARLGRHAHPEVSLHSASLAEYVRCLNAHDLGGVAERMLSSARRLAAAGADFLICPDNTPHQAFSLMAPVSPRPWLPMADAVAAEAVAQGHRRLGLTGTRWVVASDVYPASLARHGLECVRPDDEQRDEVDRLIMEELVVGVFRPSTVARLQGVIRSLQGPKV
jgi:aspartate racemase